MKVLSQLVQLKQVKTINNLDSRVYRNNYGIGSRSISHLYVDFTSALPEFFLLRMFSPGGSFALLLFNNLPGH
jgi:hypothetical protein